MKWYRSFKGVQEILLIILGILIFLPITWVIMNSFRDSTVYAKNNLLTFIDQHFSFEQYQNVLLYDFEYWITYWNTIFLTLPTVSLAIGIASMAAYGLAVINRNLQTKVMIMYGFLSLMPVQILLVPQLIVLSEMGLKGTRIAVMLIGCCAPWYVIFLQYLCKRIPVEVFEAARIDGASEWKIFRKIAIPQMRIGIMSFGIIVSADLWGMVEEPLVFIQKPEKYPLSVWFHEMGASTSYAGVILFALPMIFVFLSMILEVTRKENE